MRRSSRKTLVVFFFEVIRTSFLMILSLAPTSWLSSMLQPLWILLFLSGVQRVKRLCSLFLTSTGSWRWRRGILHTLSIARWSRMWDKRTLVSLLHLLNLSDREAPGKRLNSGPTNQSLVTKFSSMSWKLSAWLATRQLLTASLAMAQNLRE